MAGQNKEFRSSESKGLKPNTDERTIKAERQGCLIPEHSELEMSSSSLLSSDS
jgi:hypothetical protein